jgi:hypothetical protein
MQDNTVTTSQQKMRKSQRRTLSGAQMEMQKKKLAYALFLKVKFFLGENTL